MEGLIHKHMNMVLFASLSYYLPISEERRYRFMSSLKYWHEVKCKQSNSGFESILFNDNDYVTHTSFG